MSLEFMSFILLGGMVLLLALGVEIAPAMGIVAGLGLIFFVNQPMDYFARAAFDIMNSFTFTAIPLFVFMGTIYATTGIVRGLFQGAEKMFGNVPGSLASAMIVANAIFGAISGSSLAAAATFGRICFPEMEKAGYDAKMSLGAIAISGTLSVLIPPSLIMIVYGGWQDVSVARLFAGGVVPGIILTLFFVITVTIMVLRNPSLAPQDLDPEIHRKGKILSPVGYISFPGGHYHGVGYNLLRDHDSYGIGIPGGFPEHHSRPAFPADDVPGAQGEYAFGGKRERHDRLCFVYRQDAGAGFSIHRPYRGNLCLYDESGFGKIFDLSHYLYHVPHPGLLL